VGQSDGPVVPVCYGVETPVEVLLPRVTVLTAEEAETIRRKLAEGWHGPVLLTWLEQALRDRDERRQREGDAEGEEPPQP
jgi:hypothetical protein